MNYRNKMNEHYENDVTGIVVDYERNKKFFDRKKRTYGARFYAISATLAGLGGLMVILAMCFSFYIFYLPGWLMLIAGAVMVCVSLAGIVKESDVTDIFDVKKKQFDDVCGDKIGYPDDMEDMSMSFLGCNITPENIDKMYKLKNGQYIDTDIVMTFVYVDNRRCRVFIAEENFSLIEPKDGSSFTELSFDDFDRAEILSDKITDKISISRAVISKEGKTVFEFPFSDNDFSKEEFIGKLAHYKEMRRDF